MVIACFALLIVLGGTSYAAVQALPRNSVTTVQVKDHSLLARDFKTGELPDGVRHEHARVRPDAEQRSSAFGPRLLRGDLRLRQRPGSDPSGSDPGSSLTMSECASRRRRTTRCVR